MKCDTPFYVLPKAGIEKVPVPCGKCPNCKLNRVNGWVFRMLQEELRSETSHFVTLTYDTRFVPITENGFMTLRKRDFQLFMKRLRKAISIDYPNVRLKYYAVGEYGTKYKRPHYHAILFNVPDTRYIVEAWSIGSDPIGGVNIGSVSGDSIAYTMKYIDKSSWKRSHARDDREKEFPLMSKRIGANYLTDQTVAYHKADLTRCYILRPGGHRIAMPRYYKDKIYTERERRYQVTVVQEASEKEYSRLQRQFAMLYPSGAPITFEDWLESTKYQRYRSFYHNQKDRDL